MKKLVYTLILLLFCSQAFAKRFKFALRNTTNVTIQVSTQIIKTLEKEKAEFLFILTPNETKQFEYKVNKGEKIKIIGNASGFETLPMVKKYEILDDKTIHSFDLIMPILDKLEFENVSEVIAKLENNNSIRFLTDTCKFSKDEQFPLGTFLFINNKTQKIQVLQPTTTWANTENIRRMNNKHARTVSLINNGTGAGIDAKGIPFLKSLQANYKDAKIIESLIDVQNAHTIQWQAGNKSVYEILNGSEASLFVNSCIQELKSQNLAPADYQLLFISSIYCADRIRYSARQYDIFDLNADVDAIVSPGNEVVQPIGMNAAFRYLRSNSFKELDSTLNVYLKYQAQDYTPALVAHMTKADKDRAISHGENEIAVLKAGILDQYSALKTFDQTLLSSTSIDVIIPLTTSTSEMSLKLDSYDEQGKINTLQTTIEENKKIAQFNAILTLLKKNVSNYSLTMERLVKLKQNGHSDYDKSFSLSSTVELDQSRISALIKNSK